MYSGSRSFRNTRSSAVGGARRLCGRHVGHQPVVAARLLACGDDHLAHPLVLAQRGFNFAGLDPEAMNLHLIIDRRPRESIRASAHAVARSIQTSPWPSPNGFRINARRSGRADSSSREPGRRRQCGVRRDTGRRGAQMRVEDVGPHVAERLAQGHGRGLQFCLMRATRWAIAPTVVSVGP